ncbi:MAG: ATP-binding cassette domain-containing protein [Saprospiraceae bacterium]|nr:ATP-binding cassette domain-containing protein [Saprospiraceae bacterium]
MAEQNQSEFTPLRRLLRLLGQYRLEIRFILLYAFISGLINLSLPLGIQAIIGQIAGGAINASWGVLVLFVLAGALLAGILRLMQLSVMEYMQRRIFTDAAMEFALRIPRLNLEALRKEHLPELVNRFFDTLTLQKGLPKLLIDGSTAALQIVFSLLLLSFYHAAFVTFSLLLLAVMFVLFYWAAQRGVSTSLKESKFKYKLAYWLEEVGRVAATFKLAGDNSFPLRRADELTIEYMNSRAKHWRVLMTKFISGVAFRVLVMGGFLVLGSLLVMQNELNIGQFVASEILIFFVIESVEKLILLHETGYDVLTAAEKLGQFTDLELEREDGIKLEMTGLKEKGISVEMRDLCYRYDDDERLVLNQINLKVEANERVAVAGYGSSGKSTLMQILSVVKRDFTGALLFDGLTKRNLHLRSLREQIGDLSSQEDVFKGTLLENITLGSQQIQLQDLLRTIEEVGLSEFIQKHADGINTEILPGGKNIPGSIISKILIARAVINRPRLLVMEDPLGTVNQRDRIKLARFLTDPKQPWTLVCTTQDPELAAMCERVIVIKEGSIVFDGTFNEVKKSVHFERVFRQFSPETD